tara:strand:- start:1254 stop:1421 length:168 start_codon:yes stop_codon:yes gene_type:complete
MSTPKNAILINDDYNLYGAITDYKNLYGKLYQYHGGLLFICNDGFSYPVAHNLFN